MFKWLNKQGVQSDQGFIVQFTGRFTAEYRESGRIMTIDIEDGTRGGEPCIMVGHNTFRRWDTDSVPLSEEERKRVAKNFSEALKFQGLTLIE